MFPLHLWPFTPEKWATKTWTTLLVTHRDAVVAFQVKKTYFFSHVSIIFGFGVRFRSGVGTNGSMQTLYYCEVTDADKVNSGGGIDDEIIEVFELTIDECREMLKQGSTNNAPPSCLFGISWFLANKYTEWWSNPTEEKNNQTIKQPNNKNIPHTICIPVRKTHTHIYV